MEVVITGTGTPMYQPGRAGPGVLVRYQRSAVQIDAGRATTLRMAEAEFDLADLEAVLITHHHSDHLVGLADLLFTRWLEDLGRVGRPSLPVIAPEGPAADLVRHLLDPWEAEYRQRAQMQQRPDDPTPDVRPFAPTERPVTVWEGDHLRVEAVAVHHEPIEPAVAYRVTAPGGNAVVVSGDTRVCDEVERLATGADLLVHEAFAARAITPGLLSDPAALAEYHADTVELGAMAARSSVPMLVLTHLIPPPSVPEQRMVFVDDVRAGGYGGEIVIADDLHRWVSD